MEKVTRLKQIEIARKAGISRSFISRILNPNDEAKPSWGMAKKLGTVSGISPEVWADKNIAVLQDYFKPNNN